MQTKLIVAMLAVLATGCSLAFRQPEVTLEGIGVESIGLSGGTLLARVHIANPNGYDLRSNGLRYTLEIAEREADGERTWRELSDGEYDEEIRVPAGGESVVEIPIEFSFSEMGGMLRTVLDRGVLDYRVTGTVDVEDPLTRTVPYRHSGQVTLSGVR